MPDHYLSDAFQLASENESCEDDRTRSGEIGDEIRETSGADLVIPALAWLIIRRAFGFDDE